MKNTNECCGPSYPYGPSHYNSEHGQSCYPNRPAPPRPIYCADNQYIAPYTGPNPQPAHGRIVSPGSRADIYFGSWPSNGLESGKFFPARVAGLADPIAPGDIRNVTPPPDGRIASANIPGAFALDEVRDWYKHLARSGETIDFEWFYSAPHITRRHNYFITRIGWNPNEILTREQFDSNPFVVFENPCQPFWDCSAPGNTVIHHVTLPMRTGYHVILSVWEIADTGNAFYQVIDFNFT